MFALRMLFLCVMLHTMWSGKSIHLLYILPFDMLWFVDIMLSVCMLLGIVV